MELTSLTPWDQLLLMGFFTLLFTFFFAWFFEKIFAWDKATGKERKKLSFQWHCIKAIIVFLPTAYIAWAHFSVTWYAVLVWLTMAAFMWIGFDLLLNQLRNLKDKFHLGSNVLDRVPWIYKYIFLGVLLTLLIVFTIIKY